MADVKISALPAASGVTADDLYAIVDDPSGTPVTQKATHTQLLTYLQTQVWPPASGGTGIASYAVGDLIYASGSTTLAKLADVAVGNVLRSGGVTTAPVWGQAVLTTDVTGVLPSANGGTGINNAGTLTNATATTITGGGTIALAGFTLTVPATGSAALLATANVFTAAQSVIIDDAVTNTTTTLLTLDHSSSGTPAASFGGRLLFNLEDNTTLAQNAGAIDVVWTIATHATHQSNIVVQGTTGGAALTEFARFTTNGMTIMNNQSSFFATGQVALINNGGSGQVGNQSATAGSSLRLNGGLGTGATNFISLYLAGLEQVRFISEASAASSALVVDNMILRRNPVSGTPAAGTGHQIRLTGKSSTTDNRDQLTLSSEWVVATEASQTTRVKLNVFDTAAREALRLEASGSAAMIGFLGASAVVRQAGVEDVTNNVTVGGTTGTIADYTDLSVYANDAAAIRNDIYQLARKTKQCNDALRLYGLLT